MQALTSAAQKAWIAVVRRLRDALSTRIHIGAYWAHIGAYWAAAAERWPAWKARFGLGWAGGRRVAGQFRSLLQAHLPVIVVGVFGVLISGVGYVVAQQYYETQSKQAFDRPATRYTAIVSNAINRYLEVINSVGAFMAASNDVDRWEFFGLAENSLSRYSGIETLGWVPRVPAEQRETYERRAQVDGLYGFRFTEYDVQGTRVAAQRRAEYFPLYYVEPFVEPFGGNQGILGFDLASNPSGREILQLAAESGQLIATRKVNLAQGTARQAGLLTVLPIYETDSAAETPDNRRERLVGFVLGVFRIGDMIEAALRNLTTPAGLDIYLYDEGATPSDRLLLFHPSLLRRDRSEPVLEVNVYEGLYRRTVYDVAGRTWSIVVKPAPGPADDGVNLVPLNVSVVGWLLTVFLLYYMITSRSRTRIIEHSVAERTAELVASNTALEREMQERVRAEEVRAELERELRHMQKMESLGTLAGGIAHEINTPVQYVGENLRFLADSFSELCKESQKLEGLIEAASADGQLADLVAEVDTTAEADTGYLREEIPTSIHQSLEGIEQISEIVRAIKEFSHPDAKEKSAIDINRAIETTLTVARNQWRYVADVETDFDDTLPPVLCLPGEFNQVLLNLIVNAAHAISERGVEEKGRITLSTRKKGDRVEVRISDTGVGIPAENREKIFDPFFTTKDPGKGTGQGLAIAYTIITKKHKGTISLHSELGKGTTFTVSLPLGVEGSSDSAA